MKRNSIVVSLRKHQSISLARATAFNRSAFELFFQEYINILEKHNFGPEQMYNVDETGLCTVYSPSRVIATKGSKQVGIVTSGERLVNVTLIVCINALGN
jgi:hypothetical protein